MDRRRAFRKATDMILNVYQDGAPSLARCDDISVRGMRFQRILGPRLNRPGAVELEFQLPDDDAVITVRGRKVYEDAGQVVGVHFEGLTAEQRSRVRAFVDGTQRGLPPVVFRD
jgi:hypothetical protein